MNKVFVAVTVRYDVAGRAKPLYIEWDDGRIFEVDRLLDVRPAASMKAGGCGMRYTCRIGGKETYLFEEENRWFVEGRDR